MMERISINNKETEKNIDDPFQRLEEMKDNDIELPNYSQRDNRNGTNKLFQSEFIGYKRRSVPDSASSSPTQNKVYFQSTIKSNFPIWNQIGKVIKRIQINNLRGKGSIENDFEKNNENSNSLNESQNKISEQKNEDTEAKNSQLSKSIIPCINRDMEETKHYIKEQQKEEDRINEAPQIHENTDLEPSSPAPEQEEEDKSQTQALLNSTREIRPSNGGFSENPVL